MIVLEQPVSLPDTYDLTRIGSLETLLFFDIETTGFSGDSSSLYLIGCTWYRGGQWFLTQWFADSWEAEKEVLAAFFEFLKGFRTLIHFNGDGFDIPYLLKRCARLKLPYTFDGVKSVDIYRKIRPFRRLLGLESMKQKAIEAFLGVSRADVFSGGELIEVYRHYLISKDERLFHLLILHNADDLRGMPSILPILNYPDLLGGPLSLADLRERRVRDVFGGEVPFLSLHYESPFSVPAQAEAEKPFLRLTLEENCLTLEAELYEGELKYFYPNYKDYYYLPFEDTAIHQSVGAYVDKAARVRATAKTCYTKKSGLFLPQFGPLWPQALKRDYKDGLSFVEYSPELFSEPEAASRYAALALGYIGGSKEKEGSV